MTKYEWEVMVDILGNAFKNGEMDLRCFQKVIGELQTTIGPTEGFSAAVQQRAMDLLLAEFDERIRFLAREEFGKMLRDTSRAGAQLATKG